MYVTYSQRNRKIIPQRKYQGFVFRTDTYRQVFIDIPMSISIHGTTVEFYPRLTASRL